MNAERCSAESTLTSAAMAIRVVRMSSACLATCSARFFFQSYAPLLLEVEEVESFDFYMAVGAYPLWLPTAASEVA